jgi:methanogenic corrinoid protein MtbC1
MSTDKRIKKARRDITKDFRLKQLSALIAELKEEQTLSLLEKLLSEGLPPAVLFNCCMEGMRRVGKNFEEGRYFIAALVMAGEIMRQATEMLGPHLSPAGTEKTQGTVLIGTVQGDIHDLGKNLFASLLDFDGVKVVDLGVDVDPVNFISAAEDTHLTMIGLSCILISCVAGLKDTIDALHNAFGKKCPPIIIGGACVDEKIKEFVNADYWAEDAHQGLITYRGIFKKGLKYSRKKKHNA